MLMTIRLSPRNAGQSAVRHAPEIPRGLATTNVEEWIPAQCRESHRFTIFSQKWNKMQKTRCKWNIYELRWEKVLANNCQCSSSSPGTVCINCIIIVTPSILSIREKLMHYAVSIRILKSKICVDFAKHNPMNAELVHALHYYSNRNSSWNKVFAGSFRCRSATGDWLVVTVCSFWSL